MAIKREDVERELKIGFDVCKQHMWRGEGQCPQCTPQHEVRKDRECDCGAKHGCKHGAGCNAIKHILEPGEVTYFKDGELQNYHESPVCGIKKRKRGLKYITELPEGEPCVGMLMFKGTMYVATGKGVYKMVGDKLEAVQFVVKTELCDHGKGLTEYCEPCGRVNGGG